MSTTQATAITSDTERLKQYLKDVYTIEKDLYCSTQAVQKLEHKIKKAKQRPNYRPERRFSIPWSGRWALLGLLVGFVVGILYATFKLECSFFIAHEDVIAFKALFTFMLMGYVAGIAIGTIKEWNKYERSEKHRVAETEKLEKKYLQDLYTIVPSYQSSQQLYQQNITSCQNALKTLYDSDIIFPKYRNFVAVSQFYEYFMSGRCTTLEGHEGAYNLYENEVRQNIIITKLERAINLLEEIRDNQYALLDAISECNDRLRNIENNTAAIAYNTAVTAYNTAAIERNTRWQ